MIGIAQRFEARSVLSWNRFNMLIDERQYIFRMLIVAIIMVRLTPMVSYSKGSHEGFVTYYGTIGKQYRGIVTVYAKDANGEDSRGITTYAVWARK